MTIVAARPKTKPKARGTLFGPAVDKEGTHFRLWAPAARRAEILVDGMAPQAMSRAGDGFLEAFVPGCGEGARYQFRIGALTFPDPASRQQASDTRGWSVVRAPLLRAPRREAIRPWHESIICEVHVGTVTPEGTFRALADRLGHFRDAGYTALEIMPVNEFPGGRNWGYDGTLIFAPEHSYGDPEDLRALVDRAHELGLSMILDVVYNHFGEVDNFLTRYAPEWFDEGQETPWGPGIDFTQSAVRGFYYENAAMWLGEYDFDGLRFDSVNEFGTKARDLFLAELAEHCRAIKPEAILILENMDNTAHWLSRNRREDPRTYSAQWNDDMHHVLAYLVTGEGGKNGYDNPSRDPYADLEKALTDGFIQAEGDEDGGAEVGDGAASDLPPDSFITYAQNHDQIGNRADGKRLALRISPERLDFANFVKFLAPQIPLCFMGDEAALPSPFPFFFDLPEGKAEPKRKDRYRQMRETFHEDVEDGGLPDPNDPATFASAKLDWGALGEQSHRESLARFRQLAAYRRDYVWPLAATRCLDARSTRQCNCIVVSWEFKAGTLSMALNPSEATMDIPCVVLSTPVSTGRFEQHGDVLRLGPWSAVAWRMPK